MHAEGNSSLIDFGVDGNGTVNDSNTIPNVNASSGGRGSMQLFGARPGDPQTFTRDSWIARELVKGLDSMYVAVVGMVATFVTLFAYSFDVVFLPITVDQSTAIILFACFLFFGIEIICQIAARDGYLFSFLFWMDMLGTASIIFDINLLTAWFYSNDIGVNQVGTNYFTQATSTLKVARLSRVGVQLITHIFQLVRIVRLVRVFRLLKVLMSREKDAETKNPSKFGNQLTIIIIQRLVVCVFLLVIVIPLLDGSSTETGLSKLAGLDAIDSTFNVFPASDYLVGVSALRDPYYIPPTSPVNYTSLCIALRNVQNSYKSYNGVLLNLIVFGYPILNGTLSGYRNSELGIWQTPHSIAVFSLVNEEYVNSGYDLLLTTIIIFILGIWSSVIRNDITAFVTEPIERMTIIIKKLASTLCFLQESDEQNQDDDYETDVIENLLNNLAGAFNVGLSPAGQASIFFLFM